MLPLEKFAITEFETAFETKEEAKFAATGESPTIHTAR